MNNEETKEIDFNGKEFENMQKMLSNNAYLQELQDNNNELVDATFKDGEEFDILDKNLAKFETIDDLKEYLKGDIKDPKVIEKINGLYIDEENDMEIELTEAITSSTDPIKFKRDLAIHFKSNDYYMGKIEEEVQKLNESTEGLNKELAESLKELDDNVYAYAKHLLEKAKPEEGDTPEELSAKKLIKKKGNGIMNGYTFNNLIELIEDKPNIINNALKDFHNETRIKSIGKRYVTKLEQKGIKFNLLDYLNDDIHKSIEYLYLPKGDYPEGLENFLVFFIIRSTSMDFDDVESINFHTSVYITLNKLKNNTLNDDIKNTVIESIIKLLSYFG